MSTLLVHLRRLNLLPAAAHRPRLSHTMPTSTTATTTASAAGNFQVRQDPRSVMYARQHQLPMLPVPTLADTCEKYWRSVQPLIASDAERAHTRQCIDDFLGSKVAARTQEKLVQRSDEMAKHGKSWFIDWWNEYAYMGYRDPVVINVNYFFQFVDDSRRRQQTRRAAAIVSAALEFRDQVVQQTLPPDMAGRGAESSALCMHQYQFMFNSTRIPHKPADLTAIYDPQQFTHIAVVRKGHLFAVETTSAQTGQRLSETELEVALDQVKKHADSLGWASCPLTALTTDHRDKWTELRNDLLSHSATNRHAMQRLDSTMFMVCLDDSSPVTRDEAGRALWHGDGLSRYFDKSLQFVVFENGKAGFNGEHSMMDATPTFRLCEFVCEKTLGSAGQKAAGSGLPAKSAAAVVEPLAFQYPDGFGTAVESAMVRFQADVARHDHKVLAYFGYGKNFIKKMGVSPDTFVQLSIQLAYYKLFGHCRATYESAQTKKYAWGRTEVCRTVSTESVAFCRSMQDPDTPASVKAEHVRQAVKAHGRYMASAVDGRGVDRHLLGLKLLLKEAGEPLPAIFTDPVFARSSTWYLSTSQITSEHFDGYGWGEVVPDGYGIAYMVKNNSIHYNVASLKGGPGYPAGPGSWAGQGRGIVDPTAKMVHCLQESLNELRAVMEPLSAPAKAKL